LAVNKRGQAQRKRTSNDDDSTCDHAEIHRCAADGTQDRCQEYSKDKDDESRSDELQGGEL
jgi:hypothetical protein